MKKIFVIVGSVLVYTVLNGETLLQNTGVNAKISDKKQVVSEQQGLKELLTQRINSRWEAVMAGDLNKLYDFFTPAKRKLFDFEDFSKGRGDSVTWEDATIKDIVFTNNVATVDVSLSYRLSLPDRKAMDLNKSLGAIQADIRERWIMKENNWWFIGEPLVDQK